MQFKARNWASLLIAATQLLSFAASNPLAKRALGAPGMGIEYETNAVRLVNEGAREKSTEDDLTEIKGKVINGREGAKGSHGPLWKLTAETSGNSISHLNTEYILNGLEVKLGHSMVKQSVEAIVADMKAWKPKKGDTVSIEGFAKLGHWTVDEAPGDLSQSNFLTQVTVPLPLEAIPQLLAMAKQPAKYGRSDLTHGIARSTAIKRTHWVEAEHFVDCIPELKGVKKTQRLMGFLGLVIGYAKNARITSKDSSPKNINFLMPRTDFAAMYKIVHEDLAGKDLYGVVKALSDWAGDGSDEANYDPNDMDKAVFHYSKPLSVKHWIENIPKGVDLLRKADEQIDGQIGKLGSVMEFTIGDTSHPAPIFEIRDIAGSKPTSFAGAAEGYEEAAVFLHKHYKSFPKRKVLARELEERAAGKKAGKTKKPKGTKTSKHKPSALACKKRPTATATATGHGKTPKPTPHPKKPGSTKGTKGTKGKKTGPKTTKPKSSKGGHKKSSKTHKGRA